MDPVIQHSRDRAIEEAVTLWALVSSQWPLDLRTVQDVVSAMMIETISVFALNARRALEVVPNRTSIRLEQGRWKWEPITKGEVVAELWDALNRIVHAKKLEVGWERLPADSAVIASGAVVVPYVRAETDRRELAFIDPFAMVHAFLYQALPLFDFARSEHFHRNAKGRLQ